MNLFRTKAPLEGAMARMGDPLKHMGPAMPPIAMVGTGKKPSLRVEKGDLL